ncbi:hypothetical protein [Erwinia sp. 9145]|uniref:hypothetical protein n=1 Tax=Erwinia sp. 9145 TaxID=1500895 RepID=UPI00069233C6|nr:hypothetical protein [Erwinia sp. 9145]
MFISDEEKGHILIGEATISLIFNREEITPQALSDALQKMADGESDKERVRQIEQVRQWLKRYKQPGSLSSQRAGWPVSVQDSGEQHEATSAIHFSDSQKHRSSKS